MMLLLALVGAALARGPAALPVRRTLALRAGASLEKEGQGLKPSSRRRKRAARKGAEASAGDAEDGGSAFARAGASEDGSADAAEAVEAEEAAAASAALEAEAEAAKQEDDDDDDDEARDALEESLDDMVDADGALGRLSSVVRSTPLVTRAYLAGSIALTLLCAALTQNHWPKVLDLKWGGVLRGQVWRLVTPFLFLGPLNIFWLFNVHVCWSQMATLEKMMYKAPEDFLTMILFGSAALLGLYGATGLSPKMLGINLMCFTTYIWARCFEGQQINVMDVFNVPAELLPWFFAAQSWIMEGELPITDFMGIAVGHVYMQLKQANAIKSPAPLRNFFKRPFLKRHYRRLGKDFA